LRLKAAKVALEQRHLLLMEPAVAEHTEAAAVLVEILQRELAELERAVKVSQVVNKPLRSLMVQPEEVELGP
jgi:hypothetical protein